MTRMVQVQRRKQPVVTIPGVLSVEFDPLEQYAGIAPSAIWAAQGLLPYFVAQLASTSDVETVDEAKDILLECYGFPSGSNMLDQGGSIDAEGRYEFPEDPTLAPLVQFELENGFTVYLYEYAFLAVRKGDDTWMQRFD